MKKRIFTFIMTSAIGLLVCAGQMSDEKLKADFTPTGNYGTYMGKCRFLE